MSLKKHTRVPMLLGAFAECEELRVPVALLATAKSEAQRCSRGKTSRWLKSKNVRKNRIGSFVALLGVLGAFGAMSAHGLVNKKYVVSPTAVPATQVDNLDPGRINYLEFNMFNASTGMFITNVTDDLPFGLLGDATYTPTAKQCDQASARSPSHPPKYFYCADS